MGLFRRIKNKLSNFWNFIYYKVISKASDSFEKKMYLSYSFLAFFFSPTTILVNLAPWWPEIHLIALIIFGLVNLIFYIFARFANIYSPIVFTHVLIASTIFLWVSNAGAFGSLNVYFVIMFMFCLILLRGKSRIISILILLIEIFLMFFIQDNNIKLFSQIMHYPSLSEQIWDIFTGMLFVFTATIATVSSLVKNFDIERKIARFNADQLYLKATTDELTKIYNRNYINDNLVTRVEKNKLENILFSIFMVDVDKFKRVNDTYGHIVGDEVLQSVAEVLQKKTRKNDIVGRFGGEEFLIILPNTDLVLGIEIAEKIRKEIEKIIFLIPELKITASFGVAEYNKLELLKDFIARADSYLYEAKETGRNKVIGKDYKFILEE